MANNNIPTGLYWQDKKTEVERITLPFQTIETINESRATREKEKVKGKGLVFEEPAQYDANWYNRLIWGDNKYIMSSLLEEYASKIDLIYIDPPFAIGADFSLNISIGDISINKDPSAIEDKAYRDTWGRGIDSYIQMMYERLIFMKELLSPTGTIYVHMGPGISSYIKIIMDSIFGYSNYINTIIWQRTDPHNNIVKKYGVIHDEILFYANSEKYYIDITKDKDSLSDNAIKEYSLIELQDGKVVSYKEGLKGRRFKLDDFTVPGVREGRQYKWRNAAPSSNRSWPVDKNEIEELYQKGKLYLRDPNKGAARCKKSYLDEREGILPQDIWINKGRMKGGSNYPTEKPQALLERIINVSSRKNDLVADFFCGSGTTGVVAEKHGRRWIMSDLGKYAIHTTRKRLLEVENCNPFVVQNLGKYERQYWQGVTFNKRSKDQMPLYEYLKFILDLYHAEPITGAVWIHGKRGKRLVHIGSVDAPVTLSDIESAVEECKRMKQNALDILGWEWEMGLHDVVQKFAKEKGVDLRLRYIPREVMDQRAVESGEITFYELAYLEVDVSPNKRGEFIIKLKDFIIPNHDLIPEEVQKKIKKWSDYIDYWSVDWDYNEDTFHNMWQAYRTRKDRTLPLKSDSYLYEKKGKHKILIKVIDIFGNDTTRLVEVKS